MRYLIDGHNLIARMPDISLDDPNDEVKLVLRLTSWAAASQKRKVTVVFDGGLPGGKSLRFSNPSVNVVFASPGKTADALLINRIRKVKNPPEHTLISSDQQIIAAARERGMPYQRAEAFASQLSTPRTTGEAAPGSTKPDEPRVSEAEIAEWLELFGPEPDLRPAEPKRAKRIPGLEKAKPPEKRSRRHLLRGQKSTESGLTPDEVEAWLDLFEKDDD